MTIDSHPTRPYGLIDQPERPPEPGWNRPDVPYAPPSPGFNSNEFHPGPGWRHESLPWLCGRRETKCEQEEGAA